MASPKLRPEPSSSLVFQKLKPFFLLGLATFAIPLCAKDKWTELNVGPFYVDTDSNEAAARDALTQMEQVRWVLGSLLEDHDLTSLWPVRLFVSDTYQQNGFESQKAIGFHGQHIFALKPDQKVPLDQIAGILLNDNTPPLPPGVEAGLRQLFGTLTARGSRVTWGGPPPHPDLDFARMQLFATKFEYGASFHILLTSLKNGGTLRSAAANAFGLPFHDLEAEAKQRLAAGHWDAVSVSGRPLDPKRDFGEHALAAPLAEAYAADTQLGSNRKTAETAYKAAIEAGAPAAAVGFEGLAQLAKVEGSNPEEFLDSAIRANSRSAPVYLEASQEREPDDALKLVKRAQELNPRWGAPVFRQAQLTENLTERENLLKKAAALDRRQPQIWIQLAQTQTQNGHAAFAQGSWLKAEDAASSESERDKIHQLRMDSESARLDAADAARQNEVDAAYQADQRSQQTQAAKVRSAEQKANKALAAESKLERPDAPLAWNQVVPQKKAEGTLSKVDCVGSNARLAFKDRSGASLTLLWRNISELGLECGPLKPPVRVSLSYAAEPDDQFKTDGSVSSLRVWK